MKKSIKLRIKYKQTRMFITTSNATVLISFTLCWYKAALMMIIIYFRVLSETDSEVVRVRFKFISFIPMLYSKKCEQTKLNIKAITLKITENTLESMLNPFGLS